jgi:hypothetical protein
MELEGSHRRFVGKENANLTPLNLSVFCHKKAQKSTKMNPA